MNTLGLLAFGTAIGAVSGLLGIGGGILLVPGLIFLFGFSQPEAQGTSLAVLIPPIGLFAAMVYYQNGYVRLPVVATIALGFAGGALGGAKLVPLLPPDVLRNALGGLLIAVGLALVFDVRPHRPAAALPAGVAALVAALIAWILRRRGRRRRPPPEPPTAEREYHI